MTDCGKCSVMKNQPYFGSMQQMWICPEIEAHFTERRNNINLSLLRKWKRPYCNARFPVAICMHRGPFGSQSWLAIVIRLECNHCNCAAIAPCNPFAIQCIFEPKKTGFSREEKGAPPPQIQCNLCQKFVLAGSRSWSCCFPTFLDCMSANRPLWLFHNTIHAPIVQ